MLQRTAMLSALGVAACSAPAPVMAPPVAPVSAPAPAATPAPAAPAPADPPRAGEPAVPDACADDASARAAYRAQSNQHLSDSYSCVQRPDDFAGIVLIGDLVADRGCRRRAVMIDCHYDASADSKSLLARAGWAAAKPDEREKLALDYAREIELVWESRGSLSATRSPDGGIVVTSTVTAPTGNGPHRTTPRMPSSHQVELRFGPDGALTRK